MTAQALVESTASLLRQVRSGDKSAKNHLVRRYLPILERWASGRLPARARDLVDTSDVVQVALVKTLDRIHEFELQREGALLFYLRKAVLNQIRDQGRRVARQPPRGELDSNVVGRGASPVEDVIRKEVLERYEAALAQLPDKQREAVVLRIEMDFTHQQVADAIESSSPDAARMLVARALERLAEEMGDAR